MAVKAKAKWIVYILECNDGSFYTGITNDIERRLAQHECGKGAKYTRGRAPLKLVYSEKKKDRSTASKREIEIKSFNKLEKLELLKKYAKRL